MCIMDVETPYHPLACLVRNDHFLLVLGLTIYKWRHQIPSRLCCSQVLHFSEKFPSNLFRFSHSDWLFSSTCITFSLHFSFLRMDVIRGLDKTSNFVEPQITMISWIYRIIVLGMQGTLTGHSIINKLS